jgi:hypothetical protein
MSEDPQDQQEPQDAPEAGSQEPDEADSGVQPIEGDQGEYVEQDPMAAGGGQGFDPDRPVRTSAPTADQQSGVPQPTDGSNEGVEPNEEMRGPVEPGSGSEEEESEEGGDGEGEQPQQ